MATIEKLQGWYEMTWKCYTQINGEKEVWMSDKNGVGWVKWGREELFLKATKIVARLMKEESGKRVV